jgi:hypothetical protein
MPDDVVDLRSINWSHGMFLTPEHFLRQEQYFESLLLWMVRYASSNYGVVGGGPRVEASERGAARFDPVVAVDDSEQALAITVSQCRGLTVGGAIVEIVPAHPVSLKVLKKDLEGAAELGVYVVARPHAKEPDDDINDSVNPQLQVGRRISYELKVDISAEESEWSLLVSRLRRAERGLRFEKVDGFIPPCAFMSSHSELMHSFRRLNEQVTSIADRYSGLHRAVVDFVSVARSRGIEVSQDLETLAFVNQMILALEECAYEILDPLQRPKRFFQQMNRLIRSSALYLSLSPPTREYFRLLGEVGETEFTSILEQEGRALETERRWSIHDDLQVEFQRSSRELEALSRLQQALEGKYLDFRISPSLESINFFFDRTTGEPVLYKAVAKPSRPQASGQEITFVFAPLRLEAREVYRLILVGDKQARFMPGDQLHAELRLNPGEGYSRAPQYLSAQYEVEGHRNFAFDFKAPEDIVLLNDVRVSLRTVQPIRSAILYVRSRLMARVAAPVSERAPARVQVGPPVAEPRPAVPSVPPVAPAAPAQRPRVREEPEPVSSEPQPPTPRRRLS